MKPSAHIGTLGRSLTVVATAAVLGTAGVVSMPGTALASDPQYVAVTSYDIEATAGSGFGCWTHLYTGTVVDTGRMVGGTACPSVPLVNELGGSGTLNDGSTAQAQLFTNRPDTAGTPFDPAITLHLERAVHVRSIELIGDTGGYSWAAGFETRLTVSIGGSSAVVDTTAYGPTNFGIPANDRVDLTGNALGSLITDTVTLHGFVVAWPYGPIDQWTIAEIRVVGDAPDLTAPVVTYSSHPAVYAVTDTVTITCSASDDVGVVSSTCEDVDVAAWTFGLGSQTLTARAWDAAGNQGEGSTTFTIVVTYPPLKALTEAWVWKAGIRTELEGYLDAAARAAVKGNTHAEAGNLDSYRALLGAQSGKSVSDSDAETLVTLSLGL